MCIGKFSVGEATCPCWATVRGPSARIVTSKVDFLDGTKDAAALLARSLLEAEEALQEGDLGDEASDRHTKKDKKKMKISRLENRENFSNFRNKTFVPNASRSASKKAGDAATTADVFVGAKTRVGEQESDDYLEGHNDDVCGDDLLDEESD